MFAWTLEFGEFSTAEFSRITGVPVENIRLWRNRGHIDVPGRRVTSYPADIVAQTMIRYDLSRLGGLPPAKSDKLGRDCAVEILRSVLLNQPWACEVRGPYEQALEFHAEFSDGSSLSNMVFGPDKASNLLVSFDGADLEMANERLDELGDGTHYRSARVFNLMGYASKLARSAEKSVLIFRFPTINGEKETRMTMEETSNTRSSF